MYIVCPNCLRASTIDILLAAYKDLRNFVQIQVGFVAPLASCEYLCIKCLVVGSCTLCSIFSNESAELISKHSKTAWTTP
jgi:hypothetical protein